MMSLLQSLSPPSVGEQARCGHRLMWALAFWQFQRKASAQSWPGVLAQTLLAPAAYHCWYRVG